MTACLTHRVDLLGCRSDTLGGYLQGLGIWRAVVRLIDDSARAAWSNGHLTLFPGLSQNDQTIKAGTPDSIEDVDALGRALAGSFRPLPLVSPWNAGSGFAGNGKSKEAERGLQTVLASDDPRLVELQAAIKRGFAIVQAAQARGWGGKGSELWDKKAKNQVIQMCRNQLPDDTVAWLDATVAITQDGSGEEILAFNRLLGTGGNFGRQDLQATYIARAITVLGDPRQRKHVPGWLQQVLTGQEGTPYLREAVGQFDPGRAGGIASSPGEKLDDAGFANPWAFLFTIEGALFFTGGLARRQGARSTRAALPFLVRPTNVGYGSSAEAEPVMAEVWAPEWDTPAALSEIVHVFREARAQWGQATARTGLDQARALSTRGVAQGLTRFRRFIISARHGQSPLAISAGTTAVTHRPGVSATEQLDAIRNRISRIDLLPEETSRRLRALNASIYGLAAGTPHALVDVLRASAHLSESITRSGRVRERLSPLVLTNVGSWVQGLQDGSPETLQRAEFRIALALASAHDPTPKNAQGRDVLRQSQHSPLRLLLSPIVEEYRGSTPTGRLNWTQRRATVHASNMIEALARVHHRRAGRVLHDPCFDRPEPGHSPWPQPAALGPVTGWARAIRARRQDLIRLMQGDFDDELFTDFLRSLLLFQWTSEDRQAVQSVLRAEPPAASPGAFDSDEERLPWPPRLALLLPFFSLSPIRIRSRDTDPMDHRILLRPDRSWLAKLAAGRIDDVVTDACRRLRIAGVQTPATPSGLALGRTDSDAGQRLSLALLTPVYDETYRSALTRIAQTIAPTFSAELETIPT